MFASSKKNVFNNTLGIIGRNLSELRFSGESTRLSPMCSQTLRHMWVEFVGSLLFSEVFFSGYSSFTLFSKTNISFYLHQFVDFSVLCPQLSSKLEWLDTWIKFLSIFFYSSNMLKMRSRENLGPMLWRRWQEVKEVDVSAITEYFKLLYDWMKKQSKGDRWCSTGVRRVPYNDFYMTTDWTS